MLPPCALRIDNPTALQSVFPRQLMCLVEVEGENGVEGKKGNRVGNGDLMLYSSVLG